MTEPNHQRKTIAEQDADGQQWRLSAVELAAKPTVYAARLLEGQVFLVSGGGTGFGRVIAFLAARLGAKVMICGRREEKLAEVTAEMRDTLGADVAHCAISIRDPAEVARLFDATYERFGRLDVLVNNAGGQFPQDSVDLSVKGWNAVIDLNLNGTWYMTQHAARRWITDGTTGSVVSIVCTVSRGMPQFAHTCAARAGVIALTKTVAVEWAPHGIRVNCLAPGAMESEGLGVYQPDARDRFRDVNPLRTLGDAWDVAQGVVYLSAPTAKFITGSVLTIDGGYQMWGNIWPAGVPDHFKVI